eukprot:m.24752 g.24752  ORF g.24752 m.24752 type:complete len:75 (+) comp13102_c0_seq5:1826-2050(+)
MIHDVKLQCAHCESDCECSKQLESKTYTSAQFSCIAFGAKLWLKLGNAARTQIEYPGSCDVPNASWYFTCAHKV